MNITARTCANCAAFNPSPAGNEPACWNLVHVTERSVGRAALHRGVVATDEGCHDHLTDQEDEAETALIEEQREAGGMKGAMLAGQAISIRRATLWRASSKRT